MQTVSAVMSRNPRFVAPGASLQQTAQLMGELDVGSLPVCEGDRLVGMVTDRDIAVRGAAAGKAPWNARVAEVMSADVRWCFEDQPVDDLVGLMAEGQVRRVPVLSHDGQQRLVGIVALADLSLKATAEGRAGQVLDSVSPPAREDADAEETAAGGTNAQSVPPTDPADPV
jgi:CBS domain-containing protein